MILDASLAATLLLPDELEPTPDVVERIARGPLLVPQHWPLEVASLLHNAELRRRIDRAERERAIAQATSWSVRIDDRTAAFAFTETLRLARLHRLTVYDAAYLELALRHASPLASNDAALIKPRTRRAWRC